MTTREVGIGRAHAKSILFGEHAVVYGAPAIAIPIPQLSVMVQARHSEPHGDVQVTDVVQATAGSGWGRVDQTDPGLHMLLGAFCLATAAEARGVHLRVDCTIPAGCGLGSSAACARAVVLALSDLFDRPIDTRLAFDLVQTAERVAHGSPSGVDTVATGSPVPIWFQSGTAKELTIDVDATLVVADSGVSCATKVAVRQLRERFDADPASKTRFLEDSSRLTTAAVEDLTRGRVGNVGQLMTDNHDLLRQFGLSAAEVDRLVCAALTTGAAGAKLSGGGLGGCVIALVEETDRVEAVVSALHAAGAVATWRVRTAGYSS
ncbi:mevalonate kinase [Nocardia sp. NPDC003482]